MGIFVHSMFLLCVRDCLRYYSAHDSENLWVLNSSEQLVYGSLTTARPWSDHFKTAITIEPAQPIHSMGLALKTRRPFAIVKSMEPSHDALQRSTCLVYQPTPSHVSSTESATMTTARIRIGGCGLPITTYPI